MITPSEQKSHLERLPNELLALLLFYAGDIQYLARLARSSKELNTSITTGHFMHHYWYKVYRRDFHYQNTNLPYDQNLNYKEQYKAAALDYKNEEESKERKNNNPLTPKQRKLFNWIRSGDLTSIQNEEWNPCSDFMDVFNKDTYSAVKLASLYQRYNILEYFYEQISVHYFSKEPFDAQGRSKFYWAAACNTFTEIVTEENFKYFTRKCNKGITPLFIAADHGHFKAVQGLLNAGIKVNLANTSGETPLYAAAQNGHLEILLMLIEEGAHIDHANDSGVTSLIAAARRGNSDVVQTLINAGAKINLASNGKVTPLSTAAFHGHFETVQLLIKEGAELNLANKTRATPLYVAAQNGGLKVVQALLDAGAEIDLATRSGATPLYVAAYNGHFKVVECLLNAGAEVDSLCNDGSTPLLIATCQGHLEIVEVLVQSGAKISHSSKSGDTPLSTAAKYNQKEICRFFDLWKLKISLLNKSVLDQVISILQTTLHKDDKVNTHKSFFSKSTLKEMIDLLKKATKDKNEEEKVEILIGLLPKYCSNIPPHKYKFIFKHILTVDLKDQKKELQDNSSENKILHK